MLTGVHGEREGMKNRTTEERCLAVGVAGLLMLGAIALGHGVQHRVFPGGTGVEATYDDGSPMAFCDVSVFSPGEPASEYQTGITDPRGRFAFVPDTNGVWKVTVDDSMGHMVTAEIAVGPEGITQGGGRKGVDRSTGAIVGVSVIFGLFGLYCLVRQGMGRVRHGSRSGEGKSECTLPKV